MEIHKKCCFIVHRKICNSNELEEKIYTCVENLITEDGVKEFLFGSGSEFDTLCHRLVSDSKEKYPHIVIVAYNCKHEASFLLQEKEKWEEIFSHIKKDSNILFVDEERDFANKYTAGRASYVERNQAMIDESDYCVFYYDKNYQPPKRRMGMHKGLYQPKSGTALAFEYAKRKNKKIINLFDTN